MTQKSNTPAIQQKQVFDSVLARIQNLEETGGIRIPKDFSVENALKAAWLVLQDVKDKQKRPALEVCTNGSVVRSLFKMSVQGLNPLKGQGDFIVHGNQLVWRERVDGRIALAKRYGGVKEVTAQVIRKGDEFAYTHDLEHNRIKVTKHESTLENMDSDIIGAYAVVTFVDDRPAYTEIMTIKQIRQAWSMAFGETDTHKNFPEEMVRKTVKGRAVKPWINTSDDSALYDDEEHPDYSREGRDEEIAEKANKEEVSIDDIEYAEAEEVKDEDHVPYGTEHPTTPDEATGEPEKVVEGEQTKAPF